MASKVTQKIYDAVKVLFDSGATYKEVADFFKFSVATANNIKNSETFEEYKHIATARSGRVRAMKAKEAQKSKEAEQKQEEQRKQEAQKKSEPKPDETRGTIQIPFYVMQEIKKQNELLTQISNKLAFIVEQLS